MNARQVMGWVIVVLLVVFVALNRRQAEVWCFGITVQMPIALVVIFSAAMGAGAAILFAHLRKRQAR
ncbi:MAG TPA: hypothetical protein VK843_07670 [Planctomycetota bacterium]|nr:hypothetical protein [Planctomycetota bacterium]